MLTDAQIAARKIGGSTMAAIVSAHLGEGYQTLYEIWARHPHVARLQPLDLADKDSVAIGALNEDASAGMFLRWAAQKLGGDRKLRKLTKTFSASRRGMPWATAHIDRDIVGERAFVECKNVGWRMAPKWENGIPNYVIGQIHHYLLVMDYDYAYTSAIIGGSEHRVDYVERDGEWDRIIQDVGGSFWEAIMSKTPPEMDCAHPTAEKLMEELYPGTDGSAVDLDDEALRWYDAWDDFRQQRLELEKAEKAAKNQLKRIMGNAAIGKLANGKELTRKEISIPERVNKAYNFVKFGVRRSETTKIRI